ncbi:MAG: helix-turn-helix domain-containing protein [Asticcacaulis sp.]
MRYEEQAPSALLSPYIERFWAFSVEADDPPAFEHVIVPDGTINLNFIAPGPNGEVLLNLTGSTETAIRVTVYRGVTYRGVRFRAGAIGPFWGLRAGDLLGRMVALDDLCPERASDLTQRLAVATDLRGFAEAFEASVREARPLPDAAVAHMVDEIVATHGHLPLEPLLARSGLSARQARRRFVEAVGLTPKVFARIRRVRRACVDLALLPDTELAALSVAHGFADQPHFSRELRAMLDVPPQVLRDYLRRIRHINLREVSDSFKPDA